jgi:predicted signal transduction protein with EAL and GGDEF domain
MMAFIFQSLTKEIRMHYLAKVSLILTSVCVAVLFLMYMFIQFNSRTFVNLSPLAIVIMILVIDIFMRGYLRKGPDKSALLITQTVALSYILFFIMAQRPITTFLLAHPEIVLYSALINILIGNWKGFRWNEYFRFKNIKLPEPADTYDTSYPQEK